MQHVHADAVAKETQYQTQINQLSSERQLQRTPPLIPAVASAAMTDKQFTEAMQRLLSVLLFTLSLFQSSKARRVKSVSV